MKKIKALLLLILLTNMHASSVDVLECPANVAGSNNAVVSEFTVCGVWHSSYKFPGTSYSDRYVRSTSGGGGIGAFPPNLLLPLTTPSSSTHIYGEAFFLNGAGQEGFYCAELKDKNGNVRPNTRAVLSKLNLENGNYQCRYEDMQSANAVLTCDYTNGACQADKNNIMNGFRAVKTSDHIGESYRFDGDHDEDTLFAGVKIGDYYSVEDPYNPINALNYNQLGAAIDDLDDANFLDIYGIAEKYGLNDTTDEINGVDKYKWNVAGIITGLVTLDRNYFDGVDQNGRISLKKDFLNGNDAKGDIDAAVNSNKGVYTYLLSQSTNVGSEGLNFNMKNAVHAGVGNAKLNKLQSFVSEFDLKLWGFWVTINSNITKAYAKINQFAFGMAAAWLIGFLGIQKLIKSFQKQNDNTDYGMKLFGVGAALIIFFAPISQTTNTNLDQSSRSVQNKGLDTDAPNLSSDATFSSTYKERMTIFKYIIIHFAQVGNSFATATSNAAVVSYADYLTGRQNIFKSRAELGRDLKKSYLHMFQAQKDYAFLLDICIPMYADGFNQRKTFNLSDEQLDLYMTKQINTGDWNLGAASSIDSMDEFYTESGMSSINPSVCRILENEYKKEAISAVETFHDIAHKVQTTERDVGVGTELVIHNMFIMQSFLGWINAATMPISYFLLKQANLFADDDTSPSLSDRISNSRDIADKQQTDFSESSKTSTSASSVLDSMSKAGGKVVAAPLSYSVFFMAPGFAELQKYLSTMLYNIFDKDEKGNARTDSGTMKITSTFIKNLINKIPMAKSKDLIFGTISSRPVIFMVSTYLATFMYMFTINIIFMSLISMLILVKVILYFVDLLKYVFVSPFIAVWSASAGRGHDKMMAFVGQGAVLTLYPTLIVISSVIFIFAYELMQMLSGMLIGSLISQLETQYSILNSSTGAWSNGYIDYLKIYTLEQSLALTMLLVSLFIAYKIIYEGPTWFLSLFGYKEGESHGSQMIREVSERANRTSNPVL